MNRHGKSGCPKTLITSLAFAILWCAGCASTGYDKSDVAAQSLQKAAADVQAESVAFDATLGALNDLVTKPATDLKPQFQRFNEALDWLVKSAQRAANSTRQMEQKHAAYIETWNKEIAGMNYEYIRTRSEERKKEVTNGFDDVSRRAHEAESAVQPLITYLQDIRKALSADLTIGGLEAVKEIANHAEENTGKVRVALANLSKELTAASARMSSVAVQNARSTSTGS
jgi:hypothetical protein